jgi:hypothetical protein
MPLVVAINAWQTPRHEGFDAGRHRGKADSLHAQMKGMWHSPSAGDGEGGHTSVAGTSPTGKRPDGSKTNTTLANDMRQASEAGSLNADWVEGLMNFPRGWTDLDVATPTHWQGWPSLPHEPQHGYEAPRTLPKGQGKRRNKRLKALGNAVVPSQAAPLFAAINQFERSQRDTEGGVTP